MMLTVEVVSILLEVMYLVESTPEGAPFHACESMDPAHGGEPQTTPCPFKFLLDKTKVRSNETVVFKIKAPRDTKFKGFMVQARNEQQTPVGYFELCSHNIKIISCPGGNRNTATHSYNDDKEEIDMHWWPPEGYAGKITFYATVAEGRKRFWIKQQVSPSVEVY